ncbi:MAG: hypothetical protein IKC97_09330 [Clostridia bacterium]|nr:hypothetical protein [Clostridia bacterium]
MNQNPGLNTQADIKENVLAGIVGAFLFALAGGALWFGLYMVGFIASISGLVGAICAIKGYTVFAKKESVKGIVISVIMALLVMVIAWYFCLAYDVYDAYKLWFEEGEVDFTVTFFEAVRGAHLFLTDPEIGPAYFKDLALGLLFCIIGGGSYVVNKIKNAKAAKAIPVAPMAQDAEDEQDDFNYAETEQTKSDDNQE